MVDRYLNPYLPITHILHLIDAYVSVILWLFIISFDNSNLSAHDCVWQLKQGISHQAKWNYLEFGWWCIKWIALTKPSHEPSVRAVRFQMVWWPSHHSGWCTITYWVAGWPMWAYHALAADGWTLSYLTPGFRTLLSYREAVQLLEKTNNTLYLLIFYGI